GIHVPVSEKARKQMLDKMLPSQNLFSPANDRVMHMPAMETAFGLWQMTAPVGDPQEFKSKTDLLKAYKAKKIAANGA
ncbi:hypothetical protein KQE47_26705, partial [Raoultella planticola]|uniref:hypothetical protein n=1 Tax=Raoultella planticola TaxID=575 RepID=UPI00247FD0D8